MLHHIRRHTISLKHALDGITWAYRTQPNYRVHVLVTIAVVIAGIFFNLSALEWALIVGTIAMGLVIETLNTAIESVADAITRDWKEEIKIAKDVSAAAMLTFAIGACLVAGLVFIPKML